MERFIITEDGSHSLFHPEFNQHYHSTSGALNESMHIYIGLGLSSVDKSDDRPIQIFEMGFGTGLNAFLTQHWAEAHCQPVSYTGIEAYPVTIEEASKLNFETVAGKGGLQMLHELPWGTESKISDHFIFRKINAALQDYIPDDIGGKLFDVIYFDAFDPKAQPDLWTEQIFSKLAAHTRTGGVLVTYSSKGIVKRALAAAGFTVERHKGPGKKTHVLRAVKQ